ncbi:MAG: Scr1 family TA system antitoxin-like transcriptional regulator [Pseudonocardia sediminis]
MHELAAELRVLRRDAFPSATALAAALGWSQPRVSKLETGRRRCGEAELRAWCEATGAGAETAARLDALRRRAGGHPTAPGRPGGAEAAPGEPYDPAPDAAWTGGYYPLTLPLQLATGAYLAATSFAPADPGGADGLLERRQQARVRQQAALYRPESRVELVLAEPALHLGPAPTAVKLGQLDRLGELARLDNVTVSVLSEADAAQVPAPAHFTIRIPPQRVLVGGLTREHRVEDPGEVAAYRAMFDAVRAAARHGEQAREVVSRVRARLVRADPGAATP